MGVWTSAGAETRASIELHQLNLEQLRLLRQGNSAVAQRTQERDTSIQATDELRLQTVAKAYDGNAAEFAEEAADTAVTYAWITGIVGSASNIAKTTESASAAMDALVILVAILPAALNIMGAYLNKWSAAEEVELQKKQYSRLEARMTDEEKSMKALDTNPATAV